MAAGVGAARPLPGGRRQPAREALRADDVPLPQRRPAHGSRRGDRAARRDRALLVAARLRGDEPDRLGLLRPARRERRDPAQRAPGDVHLRQHRDPGRVVQEVRRVLRLVAPAAHQRPGVLPLDAVAVPEAARARAGLPQVQPGQLVPQRPDRAGQRAGRRRPLRALRRRGDQARADPVVLQGHRLRPAAAGRHGRAWSWPDARADRCSATGSVAPRVRTSTSRWPPTAAAPRSVTVYTTRPDTLFGATFMVVAADAKLAGEIVSDEQRAAYEDYLDGDPQGLRHRPDGDRPAEDRRVPGRVRRQPGQRRVACRCGPPTTCWPTTAPARSWPCPGRTSATGTSRRSTTCRSSAPCSRPRAGRARRSPAGAGDQLRQRHRVAGRPGDRRGQAHDHRLPGAAGERPRRGELPAARLAAVAAAVLGLPDPDHPLPGRRRGRRAPGPAARRTAGAARVRT